VASDFSQLLVNPDVYGISPREVGDFAASMQGFIQLFHTAMANPNATEHFGADNRRLLPPVVLESLTTNGLSSDAINSLLASSSGSTVMQPPALSSQHPCACYRVEGTKHDQTLHHECICAEC
jgi:hypothetical protein